MTADVRLTVDVEDWYDGMQVLGEPFPAPPGPGAACPVSLNCSRDQADRPG